MTRSHKIGWLVLVLAVLFMLCRLPRLHSQGFGSFSHDQPYFAKDVAAVGHLSPDQIPGIVYWWKHTDLATNMGATNWVDSIGGTHLTPGSATSPTNKAGGVYFDGWLYLQWLVSTNAAIAGNKSFYIIFECTLDNLDGSQTLLYDYAGGKYILQLQSSGTRFLLNDGAVGINYSTLSLNVYYDSLVCLSDTNSTLDAYTDGVLVTNKTSINEHRLHGFTRVGGTVAGGGSAPFSGYVRDIIVYTNALTAANALDLHYYRTNTYGL